MSGFGGFFTKVSGDNAMMRDLMDRVSASPAHEAHATVAAFAVEHGFPITLDEVRTNHAAILEALDNEGTLSDADLENVSGGLSKAQVRGIDIGLKALENFLAKGLPNAIENLKKW